MQFQNPRGTKDYYPEDKFTFAWISDKFRETAKKYGFKEIESPAFENLKILTEKEGDEIKKQIFVLEKRGDEEFGLRFDLTVPAARMFIAKQKEIAKPVKWFYVSRMWRYEAPQKGRLREFYQLSAEIFGSSMPEADAEMIRLAVDCLCALGLTEKDFFVKINNRNLLQGLIESLGIGNVMETISIIDKAEKIKWAEFTAELEKIGLTQDQIRKIDNIIKTEDLGKLDIGNKNETAKKGLAELKDVLAMLSDKKDFIKVDLSCARGLSYYTGTVFEIFDTEKKYRALAGGGRYDDMIRQFGGEDCAAVGFGMGFATLGLLLDEKMLLPTYNEYPDYYIATAGDVKQKPGFISLVKKLRKTASVEIDLMGRSLKKQMEYANKIKAKNVIVIGEDELRQRKAKVKEMETGKERDIVL